MTEAAARAQTFDLLVGSTRPAKVEAARAAVAALAGIDNRFRATTVRTLDVSGVAPSMPMTEHEIVDGARVRAEAVLRAAGPAPSGRSWLAVGLEGGVDPLPGRAEQYVLKTWAAATDGARWGYGAGGAILLPRRFVDPVRAGRELGDVVDAQAGEPVRGTRGAWGLLTLDLVGRRDAFTVALLAALAPFYNDALYDE